ncbi:MAG TPA: VWA domain-containing protein [Desulfobacterales bacterium]|nr:VWA domain-containing protein [Desulfobacterales bacterium]
MKYSLGIDLGTTFSSVATVDKTGRPKILSNSQGKSLTPSVIYFGGGESIVGDEAKEMQALGESEVASFFKRSMGDHHFFLNFGGRDYTPTDLSAILLRKLKNDAESDLGSSVNQSVITVPAYFNKFQREATIKAGEIAGLKVLRIINEPTAAALAYGISKNSSRQTALVYDLGGGTYDVTIVRITKSAIEVIGTDGDHELGGKDWDDRIATYLGECFRDDHGIDPLDDSITFNDLLVRCEDAKKQLSNRNKTRVSITYQGEREAYEITRSMFEEMTKDLMERTQILTEQVLSDARLKWKELSGVLLVGGSTRMPMVWDYVERMSGKKPISGVNVDEAVAIGAAVQAQIDSKTSSSLFLLSATKKIQDVMSHSLGLIAVNEDNTKYINSIIIQKNLAIPALQTRPYKLSVSRRGDSKLEVYMTQGESDDPMGCTYLGKYVFSDIPSISGKEAIIDISYAYNKNGVVNVSAKERNSKKPLMLSVEPLPEDIPDRFAMPPVQEEVREHLFVYLAFDLSGSMNGQPLTEAKKAAHAFVSQCDLTNTSIGLISFSDEVFVDLKACQNAKKIAKSVKGLTIGRTGYGNDAHPFDEIYNLLYRRSGLRYGIVLADGVWRNQPYAVKRAKRCHKAETEIIGIGFGHADRDFLRQISSSDQNSFFTNLNELTETFSTIAQELTESGKLRRLF